MCLCHDNLHNFYKMNFALLQFHKYSLSDIENMLPFEREIYIAMLIESEEERQRQNNQQ